MAAPIAPTLLFCNGQTNPLYVTDTPSFSAIHTDLDVDPAFYYQLQVDDDPAFGSPKWDSGKTSLPEVIDGDRCSDIDYGGGAPTAGTIYYWRIKFWDSNDAEGAWSTDEAYFLWGGLTSEEHQRCNVKLGNSPYIEIGCIDGENAVYATARSTSSHGYWGFPCAVGQLLDAGKYTVFRAYLAIDTSHIPADAIIKSATLHVRAHEDDSNTDFLVQVYRRAFTLPLTGTTGHREENFDMAYDGLAALEGTLRDTADGWTDGACYELSVDVDGINRGGDTQYILVSKNDVDAVPPIGFEYVNLQTLYYDNYDPYYLEIVFIPNRCKQEIYGHGRADTSDTQIIYGFGSVAVEDTQTIYGHGYDDLSDTQEIFGDGYLLAPDTQIIYGYGHAASSDTQTIYGSGKCVDYQEIYGYGGTAPPEMTWLNIYDDAGNLLTRITEWQNLDYNFQSNKFGILTVNVPKNAAGSDKLVNGNRIEVYRNTQTVWAGIIARPTREFSGEGDPSRYIIIYALNFNWLPYWRIIVPPSGQDHLTCTAKVDTAVKFFVTRSLETGQASVNRAIPGFSVFEPDAAEHGDTKTLAARYQDNLGELLERWSKAYDFDWWIEASIPDNTYIFKTKVPRKGVDRSDSVIFTVARHTLQGLEQWQDDLDTASICYVGGPGEGAGQTVSIVYDGAEPSGWDRRETFIAATDAEYADELAVAGHAWLDSFGSILEGIRFKLNETESCKWKKHFDLGDLVRVYDAEWEIDKVAEIKALTVTVDKEGIENIELTVGEPQPSQWELLEAGIGPYTSFADNSTPLTPTNLNVTTGTAQNNDGHWNAYLRATWSANVELDLDGYEIMWTVGGETSTKRVPHDQLSEYIFPVKCNSTYSVTIRAVDTSGNASAYCTAKTGTTSRDQTPPATPTNLTVTAKKKAISIKVDKNSEPDWAGNEFHVSTTNNFTPSSGTLVHSGKTTSYTYNTASYVKHYVKVRAYDTADPPNFSPYSTQGSATPEQIGGGGGDGDIDPGSINGDDIGTAVITGTNIVNATITGTKIASATIIGDNIVSGTIVADNIANLTITAAEIANLTITGGKIANATIDSAKIKDLTVDKLSAGSLTVGVGFGTDGYFEVANKFRIDKQAITIIGSTALKFQGDGVAVYLYEYGSRLQISAGIHIPSLTVVGQTTFEGSVWMPAGKRILQSIGGTAYLKNTVIYGGETDESVRWNGNFVCAGEVKVGAGGISWFTSDLRVDGDLDVWGAKNAVVSTSQGNKRLSAIESPEVWFMDLVNDKIDPLFEEVCEGDFHYLPVYSSRDMNQPNKWLVLGTRKGYKDLRFGS